MIYISERQKKFVERVELKMASMTDEELLQTVDKLNSLDDEKTSTSDQSEVTLIEFIQSSDKICLYEVLVKELVKRRENHQRKLAESEKHLPSSLVERFSYNF